MVNTQTQLLRLSQGQLNLLETCPRKFQHIFIEQLASPINAKQQEKLALGSRFHLLMQQRELGLPIESLAQDDAQIQRWITALVNTAPSVFTYNPESFRQSEYCLTLSFQGYLLTVIYDLFIAEAAQAQILDWKTYLKPKNRHSLEKDWQTRLYLFVLAETSDYSPENISMTYWFVQSQPQPQSLKFTYSKAQHEQTRQDLSRLLTQLSIWQQKYEQEGEQFPLVPQDKGLCDRCNFPVRCQRTPKTAAADINPDLLPDISSIQEVSI